MLRVSQVKAPLSKFFLNSKPMARFKTALLIEDDDIATFVCKIALDKVAFAENIVSFKNGQEALTYLTSLKDEEMPEVIFLDLNMPVMNGWEFLAEFETIKPRKGFMPLIYMMTMSVDPADTERLLEHPHLKGFIPKPLKAESLEKEFEMSEQSDLHSA